MAPKSYVLISFAFPCFDPSDVEIVKDVLQAIPSVFLIAK